MGQYLSRRHGCLARHCKHPARIGGGYTNDDQFIGIFGRRDLAGQHVRKRILRKHRLAFDRRVILRQHITNLICSQRLRTQTQHLVTGEAKLRSFDVQTVGCRQQCQ